MEFLGMELVVWDDFAKMAFRLMMNLIVLTYIIRYLYYKQTRRRDYLFTYYIISATVFLICFTLSNVKLELGFALGLFAIFGIIRYRTLQMPIKEMTYLFLVIGISVLNALANKKISHAELILANGSLVVLVYILEKVRFLRHENSKEVVYEKIDNVKPENKEKLLQDLQERTGLTIHKVDIGKIDFLKDTARLIIYYYDNDNAINLADGVNIASTDGDDD